MPALLFWTFAIVMLGFGAAVVINRNPVASAMFLVLLFVFMAGLFVLLEAFFIAAIQVLVYAGAIMVLFLFVIILLNLKESARQRFRLLAAAGGVAVAGAFVWELGVILRQPVESTTTGTADLTAGLETVVRPLFQTYMLPFEVTALLLLVAMVGVVLLYKKDFK